MRRIPQRESPAESTMSRPPEGPGPDPLQLASLRADLAHLEVQVAQLQEQQRLAREHLRLLERDQRDQVEPVRSDRARLAALDALAQAAGGQVPDPAAEEERRRLRVRLEERPTSLAAALAADVDRLEAEIRASTEAAAQVRQRLAEAGQHAQHEPPAGQARQCPLPQIPLCSRQSNRSAPESRRDG